MTESNPMRPNLSLFRRFGPGPVWVWVCESVFNQIGRDPRKLKDLLDLPGDPPTAFSVFEPPAGTPIKRGIVPGGQNGGKGGVPEVLFPEGA